MVSRRWILVIGLLSLLLFPAVVQSGGLIGRYEVSYMYNAMQGGGISGTGSPTGTMLFCDQYTQPIPVTGLSAGAYTVRVVAGRETGNPGCTLPGNQATNFLNQLWNSLIHFQNPSAVYPNTGFDGGTTDPGTNPAAWTFGSYVWVGSSPTAGVKADVGGLNNQIVINVAAGETVWFYIHDWYIADNLGGVTLELWQGDLTVYQIQRQVAASSDDVNEDGGYYTGALQTVWLGTGRYNGASFTGLRFNNIPIPRGAGITGAYLEVYSPTYAWIRMDVLFAAEAQDNSMTFAWNNRPSQRILTGRRLPYYSNMRWQANSWNRLTDIRSVVQEVINRPGWQAGNSFSLIIRGLGMPWGRKFVSSYDGDPAHAPRLIINYMLP